MPASGVTIEAKLWDLSLTVQVCSTSRRMLVAEYQEYEPKFVESKRH